ncbi:CPBP family intramembrane glutamic endopeptidase [Actibacterium pelagium]|uniref:CAAX prenyl protease 2/Lysostaphin resistance protein A-like domain-containing protein n=1 Tax=Actibacterium pelagium TaxID=2029103 RepID=A0A917AHQ6_9RHOB|nr:type II CAAX endopeptidase family protein [Actibacterium pelagium]GGE52736.1 hypothetical protein GCM10011517_20640 [Actibacterium pelagium]
MAPNPSLQFVHQDQFFAPARERPQLWRLFVGLAVFLFSYVGFVAIMAVVMYPVLGPLNYFGWLSGLRVPSTPGHVLFLLFSFFGMMIGVFLATSACHGRSPLSLFGPIHYAIPDFLKTLLTLVPIYGVVGLYFLASSDSAPNLPLAQWLALLPLALPLILIQVTAEELLFRGYLPQQLAARFKAQWVWMLVPAIVFAALHYDGRSGVGAFSVLLTIFVFAVIAMDLTARAGSLGPAIALHFVNNCFALLVLSVPGTITGLSLFTAPFDILSSAEVAKSALLDLALLYLLWRLLKRSVSA